MSDDRLEQARAEAERSVAGAYTSEQEQELASAFMLGARWADAHPQPRTITRGHLRDVAMMTAHTRQDEIEAMLPGLLGIEVVGDE